MHGCNAAFLMLRCPAHAGGCAAQQAPHTPHLALGLPQLLHRRKARHVDGRLADHCGVQALLGACKPQPLHWMLASMLMPMLAAGLHTLMSTW